MTLFAPQPVTKGMAPFSNRFLSPPLSPSQALKSRPPSPNNEVQVEILASPISSASKRNIRDMDQVSA
jgi:hypothetical protein